MITIIHSDCIKGLQQLADKSVNCCVTSPPYYGLRDYGVSGQIGLEDTPEEYIQKLVSVFREVRRVLKDDGTLWVNIGDSYASQKKNRTEEQAVRKTSLGGGTKTQQQILIQKSKITGNLKQKDLIGIPWMLAQALRDPYYTGPVKDVCDQVWLAAMMDAEGSICGTEYQTGNRIKTNIYISITNTSVAVIEKCDRLFPQDLKHIYEKTNRTSNRKCFRWDVERMDQKAMFLRTIYPHLVAKRKQAIIGYTFIEMQRGLVSKKKGYLFEQHEQRSWLMQALSLLNSGQDVDIPEWCIEPPSLFEPGYYLRQDIIWHKPNPMPESVTDRCTKAHEYIFLLSKSKKYYFDAEAIKQPAKNPQDDARRIYHQKEHNKSIPDDFVNGLRVRRSGNIERKSADQRGVPQASGTGVCENVPWEGAKANKRSVWNVSLKPFKEAHFATFPKELIVDCIKAGCPAEGTVLDPFYGAGTTGIVSAMLGRDCIGIEINEQYIKIAKRRQDKELGMFGLI